MRDERSISPYELYGHAVPVADAELRVHVFIATDTLSSLAYQYFDGAWNLWPLIADRNNIVDPRQIEPGTRLVIPERPIEKGRWEST